MKRLLLVLVFSSSLQSNELIPSSKTIITFTEKFAKVSGVQGAMDAAGNSFINNRINDLLYYKNYFKSYNKSKNIALLVMAGFTIPILLRLWKDSSESIGKRQQEIDKRRADIETDMNVESKFFQEEKKRSEDDERQLHRDKYNRLKEEYEHLPSRGSVIVSSIFSTVGNSAIDLITDPFAIRNCFKIIALGGMAAYYYASCRDYSGQQFRAISSGLSLIFSKIDSKIAILINPPKDSAGKIDSSAMIQQVGAIDLLIKQLIERHDIDNNIKKKIVSFLEMLLSYCRG